MFASGPVAEIQLSHYPSFHGAQSEPSRDEDAQYVPVCGDECIVARRTVRPMTRSARRLTAASVSPRPAEVRRSCARRDTSSPVANCRHVLAVPGNVLSVSYTHLTL